MTLTAWRIYQRRYAQMAFTGEGAWRFGGRWNSPGRAVIYLAQSQALAALEMLVHLEAADALRHYRVCPVIFDDSLMEVIDPRALPASWRKDPAPRKLQVIGDEWLDSERSAILRVPSAVVVGENNFLLNPEHPDYAKVVIGNAEPFQFDRRLF